MVVGFVSCVLAGALRTALSPSENGAVALWALVCKLASNVFWRAVRLGQQKGRLIRAAHRGSVLPCRRSSKPDESQRLFDAAHLVERGHGCCGDIDYVACWVGF